MKTQGIVIDSGYLIFPSAQIVPPAFWTRLKHAAAKAGELDAFEADYRRERARVQAETGTLGQRLLGLEREVWFFRRWAERLLGPQAIWPWESGWTEALVDAYLVAPAAARAA